VATLSAYCEAISIRTETELGQLKLIARNLRESGQLPQQGRGLHAAHLNHAHVARLLLGTMVGGKGPIHKVARAVEMIGDRRKKTGLKIELFATEGKPVEYEDRDTALVLLPPEASFLDALTDILVAFSDVENEVSWHGAVRCLGVRFGAGQAYPWIQLKDDPRKFIGLTNAEPSVLRCAFGPAALLHRVDTSGLLDESQMPNGVLLDIAKLLRGETSAESVTGYMSFLRKKYLR
jgi:hypothetical protein